MKSLASARIDRALGSVAAATLVGAALWGFASIATSAGDVERGALLYNLCEQCHGLQGEGDIDFGAPAIAGMNQWYLEAQLRKFRSGLRGRHFDDLEGMRMRPMSLVLRSDDDVQSVAAFVASLPVAQLEPTLEGGDAARGAVLYATCLQCHGPKGEGVQVMNGPSLSRVQDWYLYRSLEKYKAGVRGANPQDVNGILMRPMALALPDDQAMKDVIAHIMTLAE